MGLLNVDGYYNSLLSFIDKAVDEDFVTPAARNIIVSAPTAQELMSKLEVRHLVLYPFNRSKTTKIIIPLFFLLFDLALKVKVCIFSLHYYKLIITLTVYSLHLLFIRHIVAREERKCCMG